MRCAILVVDMCGFSELMDQQGEGAATAAVERLRELGAAVVEAGGGRVVNAFADNLFCVLPTVQAAVRAVEAIGAVIPISAGIGFGHALIQGPDIWSVEMNRASRLGEDIAGAGQMLLTEAAKNQLSFGPERGLQPRPEPGPTRHGASEAG